MSATLIPGFSRLVKALEDIAKSLRILAGRSNERGLDE